MKTVVYIHNISPTRFRELTPYEIRTGKKPNVQSLRIIGCDCAVTIPSEIRSQEKITKIDTRAYDDKLLGYTSHGKQYVIWIPSKQNMGPSGTLSGVAAEHLREGHSFTSQYRGDNDDMIEPSSYHEAITSPYKEKWWDAMKSEVDDLIERKSWTLVELPEGRTALRGRWVYKLKIGVDNRITRFKARWVARGFTQQFGVDFWDTFSPTARPATVRLFFALVAVFDYECLQGDIKLAFLQGDFFDDVVIYVEQPKGFEDGTGRVCQFLQPLYGLKQSARAWFLTFRMRMEALGFRPTSIDECFFIDGKGTFVILHVDDTLLGGPHDAVEGVRAAIDGAFDGAQFDEAAYYLGMKIERDRPDRRIKLT
ncbi:uncharacterized protein KD926_010785 [Aspergillus affinis]|uniref:uncharacterized protein n=1 Tax=Aspergillus affinis TaxID=1070780 RepID=UPI0022FEA3D2|nr:uncharacterized protein KD926_010785 [Aspergillus affinis]KAI9038473.1 hypothetical protein KD926_010785 [Aspergillus affinis]